MLKTYDEIEDIIINKYGIIDQKTYFDFVQEKKKGITQEEVDILSPDAVNNNDFWKFVNKKFGYDPVCNTVYGKNKIFSAMDANRRNINIARILGTLGYIDMFRDRQFNFLEIGAGYGCIRNYIEVNTNFHYIGLDTDPQINDVVPTGPEGEIPAWMMDQPIQMAFSSNVFQHLSVAQRQRYYKDVATILQPNGIFSFNVACLDKNQELAGYVCGDKRYVGHYGQYTQMRYIEEELTDLSPYFKIIAVSSQGGQYSLHCHRKIEEGKETMPANKELN